MNDRQKMINELTFQLQSKEVVESHCPIQLSVTDANKILELLKSNEAWNLTTEHEPPKGEPLILTIQCSWKEWCEVIAPAYYLYDINLAKWVFYSGTENNIIGPNGVEVISWMPWPKPCKAEVT